MYKFIAYFCILVNIINVSGSGLEVVHDDELMNLIRTEKYVVVLFSRKYCESCDNYENTLTSIREDLVENLNAWVVKVDDSQMTRLYTPEKEPAIVFFRHGIPLLYSGPLNDELIFHIFTNNKEPVTKELTDETFEHLTQAATGATTGDWFVMFYNPECIDCARLQARWEAVGAQLKSRLNVARVNKGANGGATARRFDVFEVPAFILFRQGFMYRYNSKKFDVESFVTFASQGYKQAGNEEKVPQPKSLVDDFTAMLIEYMKENTWLWGIAVGTFLLGLVVSVVTKRLQKPIPAKKEKKSKKEKSK